MSHTHALYTTYALIFSNTASAMASFLSIQPLIVLLCFLPLTHESQPSPLAMNCTSSSNHSSIMNATTTQSLLKTLAREATSKTGFTTTTLGPIHEPLVGAMQCRPDLSPEGCAKCLSSAVDSMAALCMGSDSVTVWLNGCYLHLHPLFMKNDACLLVARSYGSLVLHRSQFVIALEGLFLQLRAEASVRFFSYREGSYGDGDRVYAAAECLRSLSAHQCNESITKAMEMARECCRDRNGGLVIAGDCLLRYESYPFLMHGSLPSMDGGLGNNSTVYDENDSGDGNRELWKKIVWLWWCGGVVCLVALGFGLWIMRRRILSATVVSLPMEINAGKRESL